MITNSLEGNILKIQDIKKSIQGENRQGKNIIPEQERDLGNV